MLLDRQTTVCLSVTAVSGAAGSGPTQLTHWPIGQCHSPKRRETTETTETVQIKIKMTGSTELKAYVTCAAILYVKFVVATGIQATKTFDAGGRPPEDKNLPLAKGRREQTYGLVTDDNDEELKKAREVELRWRRIIANDLESIPIALLVFAGGIFAGGNDVVYTTALGLYTAVRCFHTYAYANELQPHRAWCWRVGVLAILVGAINSIVGVYS